MALWVDVDPVDELAQQLLDDGVVAGGDHVADRVADAFQDGSRWPLTSARLEACGQLAAMVDELLSAGGQVFDAGCAGVVGHGAGFERAEVAVERGVGFAELPVDAGELLLDVGSVVGGCGVGGCNGLVEQVEVPVLVEEVVEDGVLDIVGG